VVEVGGLPLGLSHLLLCSSWGSPWGVAVGEGERLPLGLENQLRGDEERAPGDPAVGKGAWLPWLENEVFITGGDASG